MKLSIILTLLILTTAITAQGIGYQSVTSITKQMYKIPTPTYSPLAKTITKPNTTQTPLPRNTLLKINYKPPVFSKSKGIPGPKRVRKNAPLANNTCDYKTIEERIACRINLNISQLSYTPEHCRVMTQKQRAPCMELYAHVHRCTELKDMARRSVCIQKMLHLQSFKAEHISCTVGYKTNTTHCINELKSKLDYLASHSIYMLELRAIEFYQNKGVPAKIILPFIKTAEEKILTYNALRNRAEKIKTLESVKTTWQGFVIQAKEQATERIGQYDINDNLNPIISNLQEISE